MAEPTAPESNSTQVDTPTAESTRPTSPGYSPASVRSPAPHPTQPTEQHPEEAPSPRATAPSRSSEPRTSEPPYSDAHSREDRSPSRGHSPSEAGSRRSRARSSERDHSRKRRRSRSGERSSNRRRHDSDRHYREREHDREGRERPRERERESSPRRRSSRSRTHRSEVVPLNRRHRRVNNWDIPPQGFEHVSALDAKATGQFLLPYHTLGTRSSRKPSRPVDSHRPDYHDSVNSRSRITSSNAIPLGTDHGGIFNFGEGGNANQGNGGDFDEHDRSSNGPSGVRGGHQNSAEFQRERQKRRLYIGNLPPGTSETSITEFFNSLMVQVGVIQPHQSVVTHVYMNIEKGYAFTEFRSPEEADLAITFDGTVFQGQPLRVKRPKDYVDAYGGAPTAGPAAPNHPRIQGPATHPNGISTIVPDSPYKLFLGAIPSYLTDTQMIELLQTFGELKAFHLVKDSQTKMSKGFAFCEFADPSTTELVCQGLNGMELGEKRLVVQKASVGSRLTSTTPGSGGGMGGGPPGAYGMGGRPGGGGGASYSMGHAGPPPLSNYAHRLPPSISATLQSDAGTPVQPTCILQLLNMVSPNELADDEEYNDIIEDVRAECSTFGTVVSIRIPRPTPEGNEPGIGKIFVEFADTNQSAQALRALAGRKFAQRTVIASYITKEDFENKNY
ncbi:hypothetical protein H4R33_002738 [Dimargaris cristalligena]|nr:hypothetical protein H4R33_002738 [Dimargaris cristalligena]